VRGGSVGMGTHFHLNLRSVLFHSENGTVLPLMTIGCAFQFSLVRGCSLSFHMPWAFPFFSLYPGNGREDFCDLSGGRLEDDYPSSVCITHLLPLSPS
jgi:hypothetical protein